MNAMTQTVPICPKCKSPDVYLDDATQLAFGLPQMHTCNKCGNRGTFFPEIPISELEKQKKQKS